MQWLWALIAMSWRCVRAVVSACGGRFVKRGYRRSSSLLRRAKDKIALVCWSAFAVTATLLHTMASPSNRRSTTDQARGGDRSGDETNPEDRAWGDMRGRRQQELTRQRGRVDYFVYAQMYEVDNANRPQQQPPPPPPAPPFTTARHSTSGDSDAARTTTTRRTSRPTALRQHPPNFTPEEHAYLLARLPVRQPATAQTAVNHFGRLPFVYQDLAEGFRARLAELPRGSREWERRQRMSVLAQGLADRYHGFRVVLPRSYVEETISRHQSEARASKFWEKVLAEIEKANNAWSIARLWILLFLIQSSLVAVAFHQLPRPGQIVLLIANALAYIWSTTVMCEMLHQRYVGGNAEEQELHDLMGGLI